MGRRALSLRTILSASTLAIVLLAVVSAATLVILTTELHRTTSAAASAAEGVRLAQRTKVDLLVHQQTTDPLRRNELEQDMRQTLEHARRFISSPTEASLVADARAKLDAFAENGNQLDVHRAALTRTLDGLVALNTAQARRADDRAAIWDDVANVIGVAVAVLLLAAAVALIAWLRRRVFRPVLSLAATIERYGTGDRDARAAKQGPAELREMSDRFNEMASALAAQRQAQIAYLAGVAHDLRNPLSILKMSADVLEPEAPLPPEPRLRALIQRFRKQTKRLDRMIGDFIDIAKIEAGELELSLEVHDVRVVVREVIELFDEVAPQERIVVSLPADPLPVLCDRLRIEQVITNLLSNAIKYSPPASRIDVKAELRADEIVLSVTDRGIGISKDDQRAMFEPFFRGGLSKDAVPGVGLGLSVVRRIVQAHRGRIDVDSAPGAGSTFRVYLPGPAPANQSQSPSASVQP